MLGPVGAEQVRGRNEREEDGERDPVGPLDGFGPAEGSDQRDRREDDHQLEPGCVAAEPAVEWMLRLAHGTPRTVRRPQGRGSHPPNE